MADNIKYSETEEELNNYNDFDDLPFFSFENELHLAKVLKCYDGDTIYCVFKHDGKYQKFKVRMYGYDTAEMRPSRKIEEEKRIEIKHKANLAKERLEELILNKNVILKILGEGKFGRLLGIVKLNVNDKETINEIMINEGHGIEYYGGSKDKLVF